MLEPMTRMVAEETEVFGVGLIHLDNGYTPFGQNCAVQQGGLSSLDRILGEGTG